MHVSIAGVHSWGHGTAHMAWCKAQYAIAAARHAAHRHVRPDLCVMLTPRRWHNLHWHGGGCCGMACPAMPAMPPQPLATTPPTLQPPPARTHCGLLHSSHTANSSSRMMWGSRTGLLPLPRSRHLGGQGGAAVSAGRRAGPAWCRRRRQLARREQGCDRLEASPGRGAEAWRASRTCAEGGRQGLGWLAGEPPRPAPLRDHAIGPP